MARAERIAMFFIETADLIDFTDSRWEVLFVFHKKTVSKQTRSTKGADDFIWTFVAYTTLFSFRNPFVGTNLRVCQSLVLPHMQGQGFGREMLRAVYSIAAERKHIVEVTVESPCEAYQRLRDCVDYEWLSESIRAQNEARSSPGGTAAVLTRAAAAAANNSSTCSSSWSPTAADDMKATSAATTP